MEWQYHVHKQQQGPILSNFSNEQIEAVINRMSFA